MVYVRKHRRRINGKSVDVIKHTREITNKPIIKYPLKSSQSQINKSINIGENRIRNKLNKKQYSKIKDIEKRSASGKGTHTRYSRNGKFFKSRSRLHDSILRKTFKNNKTIDIQDPDLYIVGGVAGSGKSSTLIPLIPEEVITIDSDEFKKELAKKDKSPLKKYPLAHAGLLHKESSFLYDESIKKSLKERRDVALDSTLRNKEKTKKIVTDFKKAGYDIHLLGTQIKPHKSIERAVGRFINDKSGRYVPLNVIGNSGNHINANVIGFIKDVDTHVIMDTTKRPATLVSKEGNILKNYR